jgi:hypothetical protein
MVYPLFLTRAAYTRARAHTHTHTSGKCSDDVDSHVVESSVVESHVSMSCASVYPSHVSMSRTSMYSCASMYACA